MSRFFRSVGDSDSESSSSEEELMSSGEEEERPAPVRPTGGMSRFLRTAGGSESSSDDSDDSDDSDSDEDHKPKKKNRFAPDSEDEESEDEVKKVVKSAKDKRVDEMEACAKSMDNALRINDWIAITSGRVYVDFLLQLVQANSRI
jgi:translation initiation factor 3 subunit C